MPNKLIYGWFTFIVIFQKIFPGCFRFIHKPFNKLINIDNIHPKYILNLFCVNVSFFALFYSFSNKKYRWYTFFIQKLNFLRSINSCVYIQSYFFINLSSSTIFGSFRLIPFAFWESKLFIFIFYN